MTNVVQSRLTFIKRVCGGKHPKALYKCICGKEKEIIEHSVKKGITISCGCYHKEIIFKHGLTEHPLYSTWNNIKDRCYNEDCKRYYTAGEKGITMCDEWLNDFKMFYDWCMANGWKRGLQVDKDIIPNKLGIPALLYSPEMCTITTNKENNNVKSNCRMIMHNGENRSVAYWSEYYNINAPVLRDRLKRNNWVIDHHVLRPVRFKSKNKK